MHGQQNIKKKNCRSISLCIYH